MMTHDHDPEKVDHAYLLRYTVNVIIGSPCVGLCACDRVAIGVFHFLQQFFFRHVLMNFCGCFCRFPRHWNGRRESMITMI